MAFTAVDDLRHLSMYLEPISLLMGLRNSFLGVTGWAAVGCLLAIMARQANFHLRLSLSRYAMNYS